MRCAPTCLHNNEKASAGASSAVRGFAAFAPAEAVAESERILLAAGVLEVSRSTADLCSFATWRPADVRSFAIWRSNSKRCSRIKRSSSDARALANSTRLASLAAAIRFRSSHSDTACNDSASRKTTRTLGILTSMNALSRANTEESREYNSDNNTNLVHTSMPSCNRKELTLSARSVNFMLSMPSRAKAFAMNISLSSAERSTSDRG
mmetsp:Transcript_68702/g.119331  ORF Transcript_68702/g.119331 Transcript_68702/m.119331 type:complete len:208 (-) Transcript_68702:342-965(-)